MAFVAKKTWTYQARPQWAKPQWARPQGARPTQWTRPQWARPPMQWWRWGQKRSFDRRPQVVYINDQIQAPNLVIVDEEWNNIWTFSRRKATELADEKGLDLIQMRYDQPTMTSTVKMADYWKYMYQKQKDEKEKKKHQKPNALKEMKLNYAIWMNDLKLKIKKAREMLGDWYNVKFMIKLRWREKIFAEKAIEKLSFVRAELIDVWKSQHERPKQEMYGYSIILFNK